MSSSAYGIHSWESMFSYKHCARVDHNNYRPLEGSVESSEGRVESSEGQVGSSEGQVESSEGRVGSSEGRVSVTSGINL